MFFKKTGAVPLNYRSILPLVFPIYRIPYMLFFCEGDGGGICWSTVSPKILFHFQKYLLFKKYCTNIIWWLRNRSRRKEKSLIFDLFHAFDYIGRSHKSDYFSPKRLIFLHLRATNSELPSNISIVIKMDKTSWTYI